MMSNKSVGFYAGCISAVVAVVAVVLYFMNISNAYFADSVNALIVAGSVVGIAAMIVYIVTADRVSGKAGASIARGLLPTVATFCLFAALMLFLKARVYNMAIIYGSSLEANNTAAQSAMAQAVVALVLYLVAGIAAIVAGYSRVSKNEA